MTVERKQVLVGNYKEKADSCQTEEGEEPEQGKKEDFSEDSAGENTAAEDSGREVLTGEVVVTDADAGKE